MKTLMWAIGIWIMISATGLLTHGVFNRGWGIKEAEAIVGRPMTPVSVAGVARRTTRRTIRRTSVYVATLPRGCSTVIVEGVSLSQCGGTYYQASGNQYVVVNVD